MINKIEKTETNTYTSTSVTPLLFDLMLTLNDIKKMENVESVYLNIADNKLEIYIFYDKENFEIEDKITKYITDFEEYHKYFPEVYIYPLDMIEKKELTLPKDVREI